jgi:integrase
MSTWGTIIAGWATELRSSGHTPGTIKLRRSHARAFAVHHPTPAAVVRADVIQWLAAEHLKPESRKSRRASMRSLWAWAHDEGHVSEDLGRRLPAVRVPLAEPRPAPDVTIISALNAAGPSTRLMVELGAVAGLRLSEIAAVHATHIEPAGLRVTGKGGRERVVPIPIWLRYDIDNAASGGYAFPSPVRPGQHVSADWAYRCIKRVIGPSVTPHQLRHAAASAWHAEGLDITEIRPALGHASVRTTQLYVAPDRRKMARIIELSARRLDRTDAA